MNTLHPLLPFPAIEVLLSQLVQGVQAVLGENLTGVYLGGSLAIGDFQPDRSDIDFLVVTNGELLQFQLDGLKIMHSRLSESGIPWVGCLEGSYIPAESLRRHEPHNAWHPALRIDGSFEIDYHASDWIIQRYLLRKHGIPLLGPDLKELIDPVSQDELRQAGRAILQEWWAPVLDDPARLAPRHYQAYAALTMCRCLYTIEMGDVISKTEAARWFCEEYSVRRYPGQVDVPEVDGKSSQHSNWLTLVESALSWPAGLQIDQLLDTQDFVRFTLERTGLLSRRRGAAI